MLQKKDKKKKTVGENWASEFYNFWNAIQRDINKKIMKKAKLNVTLE